MPRRIHCVVWRYYSVLFHASCRPCYVVYRFGSIRRSGSKFAAVVRRGDKQHHLGSFVTKADALRALDKFLIYTVSMPTNRWFQHAVQYVGNHGVAAGRVVNVLTLLHARHPLLAPYYAPSCTMFGFGST